MNSLNLASQPIPDKNYVNLVEQEDVSRLAANTYSDEMEQEVSTDSPESHSDEGRTRNFHEFFSVRKRKFTTRKTIS
jgi:hypothetical protein